MKLRKKHGRAAGLVALLLCAVLCIPLPIIADTDTAADSVSDPATETGTADTEQTSPPEQPQEHTLHVAAGGEGDGSDSAHPMGDIADAFSAMPEEGGRIVLHGKYELSSSERHDAMLGSFTEPEHKGRVTLTGGDAYLVCPENYRYYMSGATTFEKLCFSGSGALVISARTNPLVMGEGLSVIGISDGIILVGGYNGSNSGITDEAAPRDTSIEIISGSYKTVCGFNRTTTGKKCTGIASVTVRGGYVNCITAGFSGYNSAFEGNEMNELRVSVTGGEVYKICDVDMPSYGKLGALNLDYTGGRIENIIISSEVDSTISYSDEMAPGVTGFLRFFDKYRQGEGESTETAKIKIAFVGDSVTAGLGTSDPASESYPAQVGKMLGDAYEVGNFSEGGRCVLADSGSPYFESEAFAQSLAFQPDVVCIMLGTNDLPAIVGMNGAWEALYRDMLVLIEKYTTLESKPIVYLLTPTVRTDDSSFEGAIRDFMLPVYKQISEELGVGYVDTYTVSCDMKHHFADSVHPDAVACSYIATWLYNAIVSNSNVSSSVTDVQRVELVLKTEPAETLPAPVPEPEVKNSVNGYLVAALILSLGGGAFALAVVLTRGKKKKVFGSNETK